MYKDIILAFKNRGYAPGLALGRRCSSKVSGQWLWDSLLHENLLVVLLHDLLVVLLLRGHVLNYLVIYMYEMITRYLIK
jgi:hypothetical protein